MAENKKSVLLYCDIIHTVEELSDEEAGRLFKHYLRYINDQEPAAPDKLTQIVFEPIKQTLKRDLVKWQDKMERKAEAGRKGMAAKWGNSIDHSKTRSERLAEARKKGTHTKEQWQYLVEICDFKCVRCGNDDIVKDHITPIYQGGSDGIDNLQPLCKSCNSSKGSDSTNHILLTLTNEKKNAYQSLTKITDKEKVIDSVIVKDKEIENTGVSPEISHHLQSSNLFRKPKIPVFEDVHRAFLDRGGTQEMAQKFFDKHSAVEWFLNGSPITNFINLVPGFISNWQKNNNATTTGTKNTLGNKSGGFGRISEAQRQFEGTG